MKGRLLKLISVITLIGFLSAGCASIIQGGKQIVTIKSNPPDAKLKIYDKKGEMVINSNTPNTVTLKRGSGYFSACKYRVLIEKEGYQSKEIHLDGRLSGWYLGGNLIFGGLIGYLIVDPATGAMWTLIPKEINATLSSGLSLLEQNEGLTVVLAEKIPVDLLDKMKPVNLPQ